MAQQQWLGPPASFGPDSQLGPAGHYQMTYNGHCAAAAPAPEHARVAWLKEEHRGRSVDSSDLDTNDSASKRSRDADGSGVHGVKRHRSDESTDVPSEERERAGSRAPGEEEEEDYEFGDYEDCGGERSADPLRWRLGGGCPSRARRRAAASGADRAAGRTEWLSPIRRRARQRAGRAPGRGR
jgi:hypothetical protein